MSDLRMMSTADLRALQDGDLSRVSDQGLSMLAAGGMPPGGGGPPPPPSGAVDDVGLGQAMLIAAGRGTDQVVKGVRQLWNAATGDKEANARLAQEQAEESALYKPLQQKYPIATALGETAPSFAVPVFGGGGALSLIGKSALAGAAPEVLRYGTPTERLARGATGAVGGGIGGAAGIGFSRALKPSGVGASGASSTALDAAARIGYVPTAGQRTQNQAMLNFENYLARSPGSSGGMQAFNDANQAALNKAAARSFGSTADDLSELTLGAAKTRLGDEFARLSGVTKPQLGDDFVNALANIETANLSKGPFANKQITSVVDKGLDLASQGNLSGQAYKEIRTELANQAQAAFKAGDASAGQALKELTKALDSAAKSGLSKSDQKAWDTVRQQWANFKVVTKSNLAEGGNISAARTASAMRQNPNFRTGGLMGELADIGRVGEAFKTASNPNSGNLTQNMIYGNPFTGVPALLGNKAMGAVYRTPRFQKYLGSGLLDVGETGEFGLTRLGLLGGVPATQSLLGVQ